MKINFVSAVSIVLLMAGCVSASNLQPTPMSNTDPIVAITASVVEFAPEYPVVYKKSPVDSSPDNMSGVASAVVIKINKSSTEGPHRIIIFFLSGSKEVELVKQQGTRVSFRMHLSDFNDAAHEKDVLQQEPFVFSGALLDLKVEAGNP